MNNYTGLQAMAVSWHGKFKKKTYVGALEINVWSYSAKVVIYL
jgi:hypothetical protein